MLAAAERGKIRINELRDDLVGDLRIATTPELGALHVIPALSHWMSAHKGLAIHFEADHRYIDLIEERIDIAIRMSLRVDDHQLTAVPLARVDQVLVASPSYLNQASTITRPEDLRNHELLPVTLMQNYQHFAFRHGLSGEIVNVDMKTRLGTNNVFVAKSLCQQGHGIARILYMDIQKELINGSLVEVLPDWQLPAYTLHALTSKREQYPMKVHRCIDALKQYFAQLPGGRSLQGVA
jgi:DNA-binding transcriptional LysR family regulator